MLPLRSLVDNAAGFFGFPKKCGNESRSERGHEYSIFESGESDEVDSSGSALLPVEVLVATTSTLNCEKSIIIS